MSQTPYNSLLMSSITHRSENGSHYTTQISALFAYSQQKLTLCVQFAHSRLMMQASKLYTAFWTHLALRDRVAPGYTHTAEPTSSSPYHVGKAHALVHRHSIGKVSPVTEMAQEAYYHTLTYEESVEYDKGWLHGFINTPYQPDRAVAK